MMIIYQNAWKAKGKRYNRCFACLSFEKKEDVACNSVKHRRTLKNNETTKQRTLKIKFKAI